MSIDYEGSFDFSELRANLARVTPEALEDGAKVIGDLSDTRVPVLVDLTRANKKRRADPGELRESRFIRVEGASQVAVGYDAYWAAWQHEREYHHEIGQKKFLETALADGKDDALEAVAVKIREGL